VETTLIAKGLMYNYLPKVLPGLVFDTEIGQNTKEYLPKVINMENWVNGTIREINETDHGVYYSIQSRDPLLSNCEPTILYDEIKEFLNWKWYVGGMLTLFVALFGLVANSMSMVVLFRPKIRAVAFNQLLFVLCGVDSFFLFCNSMSIGHALGLNNKTLGIVRDFMDVFAHVSMCASCFMIVALTCERHFAIDSPHQYRVHLRITKWWKHIAYYVVPVTFCSFFFNVPLFINLQQSWMEDVTYLKINLYLRMLHPLTTTGVIPILILVVLNMRITKGIKELQARSAMLKPGADSFPAKGSNKNAQQTKREIRMAYVTFAIVGIFLSFNLPRIVVVGYEVSQTWLILHCVQNGSEYMPVLPFYYWDSISRLFMVINSSVNFLVYCTGSDQFKDEFYEIFIPDFIKSKEKGKNKDEIRRQNQLEVGEGNKAEDVAETEEHYVNALQMEVLDEGKSIKLEKSPKTQKNRNSSDNVNWV